MNITAILATSTNNVIGKDNQLPWRLPEELKLFKTLTQGKVIVMGRKTFESLPTLLPNRVHVVITRNKGYKVPQGVWKATSPSMGISLAKMLTKSSGKDEFFIIGGAKVFKDTFNEITQLSLSIVKQEIVESSNTVSFNPFDQGRDMKLVKDTDYKDFIHQVYTL